MTKEVKLNREPLVLNQILEQTKKLGFDMASELDTGTMLQMLCSSKAAGEFLELGTGTGISTCWMLAGMDESSHLVSVDNDDKVQAVAISCLADDSRVTFLTADASHYLEENRTSKFDFIFADAWPGKFSHLDIVFSMLKPGGLYLIDDMDEKPSWPTGHHKLVQALIAYIERRSEFHSVRMSWGSGLMLVTHC